MRRTLITTPPTTADQRTAALASAAAGGMFAVLLGTVHVVQPDLDPTWRFLSEYALGGVVALARSVRTWPGRVGLVLLAVAAAGILLAAAFPTDPITVPAEAQTTAGRLHNLGASLDWSPLGMLLLAWSLGRTTTWRPWRTRLLVAAAVPCVLTVAFTLAVAGAGGQFGPGVYAGGVGRLMLLPYLGWFVTVAVALWRQPVAPSSPVSALAGSAAT